MLIISISSHSHDHQLGTVLRYLWPQASLKDINTIPHHTMLPLIVIPFRKGKISISLAVDNTEQIVSIDVVVYLPPNSMHPQTPQEQSHSWRETFA